MNAEDLDTTLKKNMAKLSKSERCRAIETVRDIIRSAMYDDAAGSGATSSATTAGCFLAPPTGSSA